MEGKYIIASGPVIIEKNKILLIKDNKDDFYKLPGGTLKDGESGVQACKREVKEEINGEISIIGPLSTQILWENPNTNEKMTIVLLHYLSTLKNKDKIKASNEVKEMLWAKIDDIKSNKIKVAPNIHFLISTEDI